MANAFEEYQTSTSNDIWQRWENNDARYTVEVLEVKSVVSLLVFIRVGIHCSDRGRSYNFIAALFENID